MGLEFGFIMDWGHVSRLLIRWFCVGRLRLEMIDVSLEIHIYLAVQGSAEQSFLTFNGYKSCFAPSYLLHDKPSAVASIYSSHTAIRSHHLTVDPEAFSQESDHLCNLLWLCDTLVRIETREHL
jgi:hypothetical protein